ncbi:hypothetical protein MU582_10775 [Nocardioidaceae bacterium SCSIO 66511]|nr:hypothetical protein MU582_10775 [Nocardioidaceae bacterium SCSIO 66511]
MSFGMNPAPLAGAGRSVGNLDTDASSAVSKLKGALADAEGAVHHPLLAGRIGSVVTDVATQGNRLVHNVGAAGSQIVDAAVQGVQGDEQSAYDQEPAKSLVTEQLPTVTKPINF